MEGHLPSMPEVISIHREIRSQHLQDGCFTLIASLLTLHSMVLTETSPLAIFILSSLYR